MKPMNFILFLPDELSADSLSCYGNPYAKTPHFDRLAQEGVRFETCITQSPVCTPSRCALMTGLYPHCAGHRTLWHMLQPHEPNLLGALKESGYDIRWYGKNDLMSQPALDALLGPERRQPVPAGGALSERSENRFSFGGEGYYSFLYREMPAARGNPPIAPIQNAIEFLRGRPADSAPFFLYLPIGMPHPPYTAPEEFYHLYDGTDFSSLLALDEYGAGKPRYEALVRRYRGLDGAGAALFQQIYGVYLGAVSYVDHLLGLLEEALVQSGLRENTALIAASDHGDWSGRRRLVEKWPNAMDDALVRVPLLVRAPGCAEGHTVRGQAALFDLAPTVAELAGTSLRHTHFAQSLLPALQGGEGDPARAVFCEGGYDPQEPHCFESDPQRATGMDGPENIYAPKLRQQAEEPQSVCRTVMMRTLHYKLVRRTSMENELYDLKNDPQELCNLYGRQEFADVQTELEQRLMGWLLSTSDTVPLRDDARRF